MLREENARGTALGIAADELTRNGKLVPDAIVCEVVRAWLSVHDGEFIFDGFPRSLGQADVLEGMLGARNSPLEVALYLKVDLETIKRRVGSRLVCSVCHTSFSAGLHIADALAPCPKCGGRLVRRHDDNEETLRSRLAEYREKTEPLVGYFSKRGLLRAIDSTGTPDLVFASVVSTLEGK